MINYRAGWVLPIVAPPVRDGWVAVDQGRIVAVGGGAPPPGECVDAGGVAVMPGLVNAHTHLELSHLRGQILPATEFTAWVRQVIASRRSQPDVTPKAIVDGIGSGIREVLNCGTSVVGDISNTLLTFGPLAMSPLAGVVFYELIRFNTTDPEDVVEQAQRAIDALPISLTVRAYLAAHAPYSVAPGVFRAIKANMDPDALERCSVHLVESREEVEFIRTGTGPWRGLLEELGSWDPSWVAPGRTPVEYLDDCGFLDERLIAVHGVQMTDADLRCLAERGVTLVTCPRSNAHTGAGVPPLAKFYASGVRLAVGTDSLASAPDLNVFAELREMRRLAPTVPAGRLLASATLEGARALGFDSEFGTIAPGKSARLIAIDIPASVEDVEEYLVSGIEPDRIRWLESEIHNQSEI